MVVLEHPTITEKKRYTREDVLALQALPENADKTFELIWGELSIMPGASILHTLIITRLLKLLGNYLDQNPIGLALTDGAMYDLPNGDLVIPDGSFVAAGGYDEEHLPVRFAIAPDLAIEVVSPSNSTIEMNAKVDAYLAAGVRLVWVIYPDRRAISTYHTQTDGKTIYRSLGEADTLTGEDVLPNFSAAVSAVFQAKKPPVNG